MHRLAEYTKDGSIMGLITRDGPLYTSTPIHQALVRYLVQALPALATAVTITSSASADRSTLGLGFGMGFRKKRRPPTNAQAEERQSSWTSWVTTLVSGGTTKEEVTGKVEGGSTSRWPSFGLGSLGMGTMFGSSAEGVNGNAPPPPPGSAESGKKDRVDTASIASGHVVEQTEVVLPDLKAAVDADAEIELVWEKKDIWLEQNSGSRLYEKRRLMWIIVRLQ
jgi:hypothetical protein